jgi:AcrR family transcriptional regulator
MRSHAVAERSRRSDAAANRERLLGAARTVFAEHGLDGSVEEVARVAGVGMGTLYRRFPTKQALIDELVGGVRLELLETARRAERLDDGRGLEQLLQSVGELQATQLGCLSRLWDHSDAELDAMRDFRRIVRCLLATAQDHHRVRPDVTSTDITVVFWSLRGVIETTRTVAPEAWRRHLELLTAGLRPAADGRDEPLRHRPLSETQARRITNS